MRRRQFITLLGGTAAWPLAVRAQQPQKLPVIGILVASPLPMIKARAEAFRRGLRDLGYIEQRDVIGHRRCRGRTASSGLQARDSEHPGRRRQCGRPREDWSRIEP
jgi:hypothetical protein